MEPGQQKKYYLWRHDIFSNESHNNNKNKRTTHHAPEIVLFNLLDFQINIHRLIDTKPYNKMLWIFKNSFP